MPQGELFSLHVTHVVCPRPSAVPLQKLPAFPAVSLKTAIVREVSLPATWQCTSSFLPVPFVALDNSQRCQKLDALCMWEMKDNWHGAVMTQEMLNHPNTVPRRKGHQAQAKGSLGHLAIHLTQPHLSTGQGKPRGAMAVPTWGCSLTPCTAEFGHVKIFLNRTRGPEGQPPSTAST